MPLGLIGFDAEISNGDDAVPFSLLIDGNLEVNGFWKQTSTGDWVNLASPEFGGQVISVGNMTRLDFVIEDNGPFDTNPADGAITDPGAPGYRDLREPPMVDCPYRPFQPDSDADGVPDALEVTLGLDPALKDNDVVNNNLLFVQQLYRDLLWREGEDAGLNYWTDQLQVGASHAEVVAAFVEAPEYQTMAGLIGRYYEGVLGRAPDACGLDYWVAQSQAGVAMEQIANAFLQSSELLDQHGPLTSAERVETLFGAMLERAPSEQERTTWTQALETGSSAGALLLELAQQPEYLALREDRLLLNSLYLSILDRAPDDAGVAWWESQLAQSNDELGTIAGFMTSSEYQERFLPTAFDAQASGLDDSALVGLVGQAAPAEPGAQLLG
ncbi:hypothetical protein Thiowin_00443 [Thiorhodovibrio winogradskyi]|uniref:DUF4214 domain-containing protein n=2 Tax=Thiorhodovibrio winogradskyi TaxID=77007 RepID=A0ABZ0S4Q1_9GAMM